MARVRLEDAKEWQLTDKSNDIRGRELRDSVGRTLGTIQTMIVDTDSRQVEAVVLEDSTEYPVRDLQLMEQAIYFIPSSPAPVAPPPAPAAYAPPVPEPPTEVPSPAVPPPASPPVEDYAPPPPVAEPYTPYVPPTTSAPSPLDPTPAGDAGGALDVQHDAYLDRVTPAAPEPPTYVPPSPYAPPSDYAPPAYVPPTTTEPAVPPPAEPAAPTPDYPAVPPPAAPAASPPIVQSPEPAVPPPAPPAGETAYPAEPYLEPYAEPPAAVPFTGTAIPGNYAEPVRPGDYTGDYTDAVGYTETAPHTEAAGYTETSYTEAGSYADAGGYTGEGSLDVGEPTPEPLDPSTLYTGSESDDDSAFDAGAYADADADAVFSDLEPDRDAATPGDTVTFGEAATYSETGAYVDLPPSGDVADAAPPPAMPPPLDDARPVEPSLGGGAPVVAPPDPGHAAGAYAGLAPEPAFPTHASQAEADAGFAAGTGPTDPPGPPPYDAPPYTPPVPPYEPPPYEAAPYEAAPYEAPAYAPPPPPAYPGAPLAADTPAADAPAADAGYRAHFGQHYADSGTSYDDLADAYRFGVDAASDPEFADGDEDRLRERFNLRYGYPADDRWAWLGARNAVRRGYEGG